MSADVAQVQDLGVRHKVLRMDGRPGITTIITEIDESLLNGDVVQQLILDSAVRGIVREYLNANHERILAAIDPNLIARLAQVELAQQTLQHLRGGSK
jgi:hypothetical protein